ncbi:HAD-IIA family hydrolase [Cupriavidus basilensis]|uniref:HAD-IIA family hydrolase n=1 Tax=Cupriavidus basilensis TaxID=68895 RepID=UPI0007C4BA36|nr:HAD-IIA family hydrolase [Cupriavidus basilensis]
MTDIGPLSSGNRTSLVPGFAPAVRSPWHDPAWHYIIDLDGTLIRDGAAMPGAAALLEALHGRYAIVSNNSTDTAVSMARKLRKMGLVVAPAQLVLAGEMTVNWLWQTSPGARVYLLGSPVLRRYAQRVGCRLVEQNPDVVLLALDRAFNYRKLLLAVNVLRTGARLIVTNPDLSHPGGNGWRVPETGALLAAVLACADVRPVSIIGKPSDVLFREGLRRLRAKPAQTLMIGDNPATDAAGAVAMGMSYLLLGTGPEAEAETPAQLLETWGTRRTHLHPDISSV